MAFTRAEDVLCRIFDTPIMIDPYEVKEFITQYEEKLADFATDDHDPSLGYILGNQRMWIGATKVLKQYASNEHLYAEVRKDAASGLWVFSYPMTTESSRAVFRKYEYSYHLRQTALSRALLYGFTDVLSYVEPIPDYHTADLADGYYHFISLSGEPPANSIVDPKSRVKAGSKNRKGSRPRETVTAMTSDDLAEMFF